jgi:hypothetical protein
MHGYLDQRAASSRTPDHDRASPHLVLGSSVSWLRANGLGNYITCESVLPTQSSCYLGNNNKKNNFRNSGNPQGRMLHMQNMIAQNNSHAPIPAEINLYDTPTMNLPITHPTEIGKWGIVLHPCYKSLKISTKIAKQSSSLEGSVFCTIRGICQRYMSVC